MLIVGTLLAVIVVLAVVGLLFGAGDDAAAEFYGLIMPAASARSLVMTGIVVALAGVLAWKQITTAITRRRDRPDVAEAPVNDDQTEPQPR